MLELPIALLFGGQSLLHFFFFFGKGGGGGGVDFSISTPKVIIKVFCEVMLFECSRAKLYNSSQNDHLFFLYVSRVYIWQVITVSSILYSFVLDNSTHFFIYRVDSQGKYDDNYSGHLF